MATRTKEQIQQDYGQACAELGDMTYRIAQAQHRAAALYKRLGELEEENTTLSPPSTSPESVATPPSPSSEPLEGPSNPVSVSPTSSMPGKPNRAARRAAAFGQGKP